MSVVRSIASLLPRNVREGAREFLENTLAVRLVPVRPPGAANAPGLDILDLVLTHYRQTHPEVLFIQVGAFDGASGDPMFHLVKRHGLKGALVEPQRGPFTRLRDNYGRLGAKSLMFLNAAIGEQDGSGKLYTIRPDAECPAWLHQNASFSKEHLLRLAGTVPGIKSLIQEEEVRILTFDTLCREAELQRVDFLAVDTEGYDAEVLRLFDVPTRKPAIIQYEHSHLRRREQDRCLELLAGQGYRLEIGESDTLAYNPGAG